MSPSSFSRATTTCAGTLLALAIVPAPSSADHAGSGKIRTGHCARCSCCDKIFNGCEAPQAVGESSKAGNLTRNILLVTRRPLDRRTKWPRSAGHCWALLEMYAGPCYNDYRSVFVYFLCRTCPSLIPRVAVDLVQAN